MGGKKKKSIIPVLLSVFTVRLSPIIDSPLITAFPSYPYCRNDGMNCGYV